jgi:hypothetical protein
MLTHLLDNSFPPWTIKLMMREMVEPSEACRELTEQKIRPMATVLFGIVAELLPPQTPLEKLQMTCFSVIGQCLFYRTQRSVARHLIGPEQFDAFTIDQLADHITHFTLNALGKPLPRQHSQESAL